MLVHPHHCINIFGVGKGNIGHHYEKCTAFQGQNIFYTTRLSTSMKPGECVKSWMWWLCSANL